MLCMTEADSQGNIGHTGVRVFKELLCLLKPKVKNVLVWCHTATFLEGAQEVSNTQAHQVCKILNRDPARKVGVNEFVQSAAIPR